VTLAGFFSARRTSKKAPEGWDQGGGGLLLFIIILSGNC